MNEMPADRSMKALEILCFAPQTYKPYIMTQNSPRMFCFLFHDDRSSSNQ